jgi:hypothetical protein
MLPSQLLMTLTIIIPKPMENKQTALEWLKDWMGKNQYFIGNDLLEAIEQAKAMEKEQIVDSFDEARTYVLKNVWKHDDGIRYYENKYGEEPNRS